MRTPQADDVAEAAGLTDDQIQRLRAHLMHYRQIHGLTPSPRNLLAGQGVAASAPS